jgi:hypothetical protein
MHFQPVSWCRRAAAALPAVALVAILAAPAQAKTTELADESGVLQIDAPGRWREQKSDRSISANGFLGGIKRAELFAQLYDDLTSAEAAARRWKEARSKEGGDPVYEHTGDVNRWTAHSASEGTIDYVRALDGAGKAAVVWVRLSGAPGTADADAKALLDAARLAAPTAEQPGATETPGEKPPAEGPAAGGTEYKDPDFRVRIRLPEAFTPRKDVTPAYPRAVSLSGPVGSDAEAFFDLYVFDSFDRADACGKWWKESERMGWSQGVHIEGDVTAFRVEVRDETWTRHVRIVATDAGVVGIKLDVASQAEKAALEVVDGALATLEVLKKRPSVPAAPPGMKAVEGEKSVLQHALPDGADPADFQFQADVVEEHVTAVTGLARPDDRRAVLRVYRDAKTLLAALRPLGFKEEQHAHWSVRDRVVLTHAGAFDGDDAALAAVRMELARAALQRRLGFRAPFWVERGVGHLIASAAFNKGRIDQPHPKLVKAVADAAPSGMELQSVRWWSHEGSVGHPERAAISWSYVHFFLHGGAAGRKYVESWTAYMTQLQATGDPVEAGSAFDFARETEMAEDWQLWARKLE